MKKNFHHGEHGGHGEGERGAEVEFFWKKQALNSDTNQKLFFHSVFSVSSVVKPLCFPLA
jgi:hypothetical protein